MSLLTFFAKSRIALAAVLLVAAAGILAPNWRSSFNQSIRLPDVESIKLKWNGTQALEPTVSNATEIKAQSDVSNVALQPISIGKKSSWNPNPAWRSDASWPSNSKPVELRPITIEKIPDSFLLPARTNQNAPTIGDAVISRGVSEANSTLHTSNDSNRSGIVPWSAFAEESPPRFQKISPNLAAPQPHPIAIGQTVSSGHSLPDNLPQTQSLQNSSAQTQGSLQLPVSSPKYIRQPTTRR